MTARSVPTASLYFIASVSISLAALAVLAGVSLMSAIMRAATAFLFFSILGWAALFALRTSGEQENQAQSQEEDSLGTQVDVSIGPDEDEDELDAAVEREPNAAVEAQAAT